MKRNDLLRFANDHDVRHAEKVLHEVETAIAAWPDHARAAGVPDYVTKEVQGQLPGWG